MSESKEKCIVIKTSELSAEDATDLAQFLAAYEIPTVESHAGVERLKAEVEQLKDNNSHAGLRVALQKAGAEVERLKADNDGLKKGCGELNDKLSLACTQNSDLTIKVKALSEDNTVLKAEIESYGKDYALLLEGYDREQRRAEAAEKRADELEQEKSRLIRYAEEQALLPSVSFEAARELVSDIKKDATDVGGCYEVSTGSLDSLFERYTDAGACSLLNKFAVEQKIKALDDLLTENEQEVRVDIGTVRHANYEMCDVVYGEDIRYVIEQLRAQAKGQ